LYSPNVIHSPLANSFDKKAKNKPITPPEYDSSANNNNKYNNNSGSQNKQISALANKQIQTSSKSSKTNSNSNLLIFSNKF